VEKLSYSSRTERVLSHSGDTKLFFPGQKRFFPQEEPFISRKNEILNSSLLRDSNECIGDGECHYTYTFKTIFNSYIIMSISLLELVVNGTVEKLSYSSRTERVLSHSGDTKLFFPGQKRFFPQQRN
jgi:hypothetical protein